MRTPPTVALVQSLSLLLLMAFAAPTAQARRTEGDALPEFAYRSVNVRFVEADEHPVADAAIYGYCRELDLVWPRRHLEARGRTNARGVAQMGLPPGKWEFFALGRTRRGELVAAWTDARERNAGETIRLAATVKKRWTIDCESGERLSCKRVLMKPQAFPIWLAADLQAADDSLNVQISAGSVELWAEGDAATDRCAFVLNYGSVSDKTADGKRMPAGQATVVECNGGGGRGVLSWSRSDNFDLEGEVAVSEHAKVLFTPGDYTLGYRRPIAKDLTASFVGQFYRLGDGHIVRFDLNAPLAAAIDQELCAPDENRHRDLVGKLYMSDANGHVLGALLDEQIKLVTFDAVVTVGGKSLKTVAGDRAKVARAQSGEEVEPEDESEVGARSFRGRFDQTLFRADVGIVGDGAAAGAVWTVTIPPGVLGNSALTLAEDEPVPVTSATFKTQVPKVIERAARNVLMQAELLSRRMEKASFRQRHVLMTGVTIKPSSEGGSAVHTGAHINITPRLFYLDQPMAAHTFPHELGHNHALYHGGLLETVVEISRSGGSGEHLTRQEVKWDFFDRMNGRNGKDRWPYEALYLYCYAEGGGKFVRFMSINEPLVRPLEARHTKDELTGALCSLALGREMTAVFQKYGMDVSAESLAATMRDVSAVCQARH